MKNYNRLLIAFPRNIQHKNRCLSDCEVYHQKKRKRNENGGKMYFFQLKKLYIKYILYSLRFEFVIEKNNFWFQFISLLFLFICTNETESKSSAEVDWKSHRMLAITVLLLLLPISLHSMHTRSAHGYSTTQFSSMKFNS